MNDLLASAIADDLVYDVGMHMGEDTAYYLKKGFRVIGFEANPEAVARCRGRFASELAEARLTIVEGAIGDHAEPTTVRLFVHPEMSVWATTNEDWAKRNSVRGASKVIEVPSVDFSASLERFGIPHYLKIDIEGDDLLCFEALRPFEQRPRYVSIESEKVNWNALEAEFDLLESLGYDRFAVSQQAGMETLQLSTHDLAQKPVTWRFELGSSGPFGEDLTGPWTDREAALKRYRIIFREYRRFGDQSFMARTRPTRAALGQLSRLLGRPLPGWYDTHATRSLRGAGPRGGPQSPA